MAATAGMLLPFGRTWHATEAEAKQHCLETMKIRLPDWIARDGEPEFVEPFTKGLEDDVTGELRGDETIDRMVPSGRSLLVALPALRRVHRVLPPAHERSGRMDQAGTIGALDLRSACMNSGDRRRCACTSSGGVRASHWFRDTSA